MLELSKSVEIGIGKNLFKVNMSIPNVIGKRKRSMFWVIQYGFIATHGPS